MEHSFLFYILLLSMVYSAVLATLLAVWYLARWWHTRKDSHPTGYLSWHIAGVGFGSVLADLAALSAVLGWFPTRTNIVLFAISRIMFSIALTLILLFINQRNKWMRERMEEASNGEVR